MGTIQAAHSPAQRARVRRSLVQLGSLLAVTLIVVGVFALFSVWSLNRAHTANYEQLSRLLLALDDGRSAQTFFKVQVQEWKNVLLRGAAEADLNRHLDAFTSNEGKVQERLKSLAAHADAVGLSETAGTARALAEDHLALGQLYRNALAKGRETRWDPFAIDQDVRGIDRRLNEALDEVASTLLQETERRRLEAQRQEAARYGALRSFLSWSIAIAVAIVGVVLWDALRRRNEPA